MKVKLQTFRRKRRVDFKNPAALQKANVVALDMPEAVSGGGQVTITAATRAFNAYILSTLHWKLVPRGKCRFLAEN